MHARPTLGLLAPAALAFGAALCLACGSDDIAGSGPGDVSSSGADSDDSATSGGPSGGMTSGEDTPGSAGSGSMTSGADDETGTLPTDTGAERGCEVIEALPEPERFHLIGDSVFVSNVDECADVGDFVGRTFGERVEVQAVGGTELGGGKDGIPGQYIPGGWEWVIVDGGANDLGNICDCDCSAEQLDALASADASEGLMVELVDQIVGDGSQVVLLGYYEAMPDSEFGPCIDEQTILSDRYAAIADARPEVVFVDGRELMDPESTPVAYQEDGVHPSPTGSALLADGISLAILGR
ncbi:MAG: SGNH/GDSL hydrolase family protein [Myxococcota bacterium]